MSSIGAADYVATLGATLDESIVGGKGASLASMLSAGFPVPAGFSVTAQAYQRFLDDNGLTDVIQSAIDGLDATDLTDMGVRSERIQSVIEAGAMPPEVEGQARAAYRELTARPGRPGTPLQVSVRSSATAEDLPGASFAGQHDTYLNILDEDAVVVSVKRCWASLWSPHAMHYRERRGFEHLKVLMSVVVQEMVPSTSSGVMFTVNPVTGDRSEMVINSCWGLGEAIVSGLVTPDNIVVTKEGLGVKALDIAPKEIMITATDEGGTVEASVPRERMLAPSISKEQIVELAQMGVALEAHYGAPQDIEWSLVEDRLFLLQSRPITTL